MNPSGDNILITGGAGFIGSHVVRHFATKYPAYHIVNLDKLTYAGNLENLTDIEEADNYTFVKGDIQDEQLVSKLFQQYKFTGIIHLAAESHVDRSITDPGSFLQTNVNGTVVLLNAALQAMEKYKIPGFKFHHISTDEVYGSLGNEGSFTEETPYSPRSPYAASKASSDHFVRAYFHTYGLPVLISNCSNNYGPCQFPEKLIPLVINNIREQKALPVYGKGENVRDWLYVQDHAEAIDIIFHKGKSGETYNIGGRSEWKNIDLVRKICDIMDEKLGNKPGTSRELITFVTDRKGHDFRYSIDPARVEKELGWKPRYTFEKAISETIDWYMHNSKWLKQVTSGAYREYYLKQYGNQ